MWLLVETFFSFPHAFYHLIGLAGKPTMMQLKVCMPIKWFRTQFLRQALWYICSQQIWAIKHNKMLEIVQHLIIPSGARSTVNDSIWTQRMTFWKLFFFWNPTTLRPNTFYTKVSLVSKLKVYHTVCRRRSAISMTKKDYLSIYW